MINQNEENEGVTLDITGAEVPTLNPALENLVRGYISYSAETILERALPEIDGFKPSQRRILHTLYGEKVVGKTKCANVVGATMKYHPHGDMTIYDTLVKMVDKSEYLNVPYIEGKGNFGHVYNQFPPAASRYTECSLSLIGKEFFNNMDGVTFVPTYDDKRTEPKLLPVPFPVILCNCSKGIAVGMASGIPSYNFNEVNLATIELVETGKIANPLIPDFTTGGYVADDKVELQNIMDTGRGKITMRGSYSVEGKRITITQIPFYTTVDALVSQARSLEYVSSAMDETDRHGLRMSIEVGNKANVDKVLRYMLSSGDLQMCTTTNMNLILDNAPITLGVTALLKAWVKFRKGVLAKSFGNDLANVEAQLARSSAILKLVENVAYVNEYIDALRVSEVKAIDYLHDVVGIEERSHIDDILDMKSRQLFVIERRRNSHAKLLSAKASLESQLANIEGVIIQQLRELNAKYPSPRKSQITDTVYSFEKEEEIKSAPVPVQYSIVGSLFKYEPLYNSSVALGKGWNRAMSDDAISLIDNKGRLLRLHLDRMQFTSGTAGIYIPNYVGIDETADTFEVIAHDIIRPEVHAYMYSDGLTSVLDLTEWCDIKKANRKTVAGMPPCTDLIIAEIDLSIPLMLVITEKGKLGVFETNFKQKFRTGRTRVVQVANDDKVLYCVPFRSEDALTLFPSFLSYMNKIRRLSADDSLDWAKVQTLL